MDAVVEGSVVRANGRVRISAKLIQTSIEQTLWAASYERDFTDVLGLQSDVATAIARGIQVELSAPEASQLANRRVVVPQAYEAYLKGRFEAEKRTPGGDTGGGRLLSRRDFAGSNLCRGVCGAGGWVAQYQHVSDPAARGSDSRSEGSGAEGAAVGRSSGGGACVTGGDSLLSFGMGGSGE